MGVQRDGAFCEYIAMPVERIYEGKGLSAQELALIEPFSISQHAVSRAEIKETDNVLVIGAGPIGLFALLAAKQKCNKIVVADILDNRLALATEYGADAVVNTKEKSLEEFTAEFTDGNGFDVCIEACGAPETFLGCIDNAAFAGNIILIGNGKTCLDLSVFQFSSPFAVFSRARACAFISRALAVSTSSLRDILSHTIETPL